MAGCLDTPDHLAPPVSILASYDFMFDYQVAVRKVLLTGESDRPYFRVVSLPAFFAEWSLTIEQPAAGEARVEVAQARKQVYTGKGYRAPGVEKFVTRIDAPTAEALRAVLEKMLLETRSCETLGGLGGFDGVTYSFSGFILLRGVLAGETWSPHESTRAGQLVAAITLLYRIARDEPDAQLAQRQQFVDIVNALKAEVVGKAN